MAISRRAASAILRSGRVQTRKASTHAHPEVAEAEHYAQETIGSTTWRNFILYSLVGVGFYKFAPAQGEEVAVTRWIKSISFPTDFWVDHNSKHAALSKESAAHVLLVTDAKKERVHRYRFQQESELISPFRGKVGEY
ncbi:hypothetical protein BDV98DRAFT_567118 [Pterulicium gracile]|uniref:Uncharacterized protein n=1 Tax=Pterulicium gracile TaxID=1884261 RepID=A0A5C3QMS2_9AGAR|nr:hypothetical protein BDV98DRAFT_567118 [Pterula gracilis]